MKSGYESPIQLINESIINAQTEAIEGFIFKSVLNVGVSVDKDELIKALNYDRHQYAQGYDDALRDVVALFEHLGISLFGNDEEEIKNRISAFRFEEINKG